MESLLERVCRPSWVPISEMSCKADSAIKTKRAVETLVQRRGRVGVRRFGGGERAFALKQEMRW